MKMANNRLMTTLIVPVYLSREINACLSKPKVLAVRLLTDVLSAGVAQVAKLVQE